MKSVSYMTKFERRSPEYQARTRISCYAPNGEKMKKILLITLSVLSPFLLGAEYSNISPIKSISVAGAEVRVRQHSMKPVTQCEGIKDHWYSISLDDPHSKEAYSALLTAKATQEKVFFMLSGCDNNYAKIRTVYLCDNDQCL